MSIVEGTSPSRQMLRYFEYEHLPSHLKPVSMQCYSLAAWMINQLPDGDQLETGLRKLLEAKDCFVRAALDPRPEVETANRLITRLPGHAMINALGDVFYPDNDDDRERFIREHGARHVASVFVSAGVTTSRFPSTDSCTVCGYQRDTPNHTLGCVEGRREAGDTQ